MSVTEGEKKSSKLFQYELMKQNVIDLTSKSDAILHDSIRRGNLIKHRSFVLGLILSFTLINIAVLCLLHIALWTKAGQFSLQCSL